jgi:hypothetical protein
VVFGNSPKTTILGHLKWARFSRQYRLKPLLFAAFPQYRRAFQTNAYFWRGSGSDTRG